MKSEDYKRKAAEMRKEAKKATASKAAARRFLVRAGIVTDSGKLTEAYK